MKTAKPMALVEGVDYTMERGKLVFTKAYHLKRGYCCNSKCRHCPYGVGGGGAPRVEISGLPVLAPGKPTS